MAPLPSPGNVIRVEQRNILQSPTSAGSRFFLSYTGNPPSSGALSALAGIVNAQWGVNIAPHVSIGDALELVSCVDLSSATGAAGEDTTVTPGQAAGNAPASEICVIVNHHITRRYRGGQPKTFLRMGMESDRLSETQWSTTSQAAFLTAWENYISAILNSTTSGISIQNLVNVSWYAGFTPFQTPTGRWRNIPKLRTTPVVDNIVSSSVNQTLGSQRRRRGLL